MAELAENPTFYDWDKVSHRESVRIKRRMAAYEMAKRINPEPTVDDVAKATSLLNGIRRMALSNYNLDGYEGEHFDNEYAMRRVDRKRDRNYRLYERYLEKLKPYRLTIEREWSIENVYEPTPNGGHRSVWPIGLHFFD